MNNREGDDEVVEVLVLLRRMYDDDGADAAL